MARRRPLIVLAAAAATAVLGVGCNSVFGLVPTSGPDSDGDGRSDTDDNCPLVANADQANADGDALGDACDPCDGPQSGHDRDGDGFDDLCDACPDGSNHDEDGDGALDGCDVCPGVADSGDDSDGDGIGDACDVDPTGANTRVFFDGFGPPRAGWETWFDAWTGVGDDLAPVVVGGEGTWNRAGHVSGSGWWVEAEIEIPPPIEGDELGLQVRNDTGAVIMFCYVDRASGVWRPNGYQNTTIELPAVARFRLRYLGNSAIECTIDGQVVATDPADIGPPVMAFVPSLLSLARAAFRWVDVVAAP